MRGSSLGAKAMVIDVAGVTHAVVDLSSGAITAVDTREPEHSG